MKFLLLGYMASGKSTIGKVLADEIGYKFIDLDDYIENNTGKIISDIFKNEGEIKFRKLERFYLEEILKLDEDLVVSLGGGTPCYYDSIDLINSFENTLSVYLRTKLDVLVNRLYLEKESRPLVSRFNSIEDLKEFVGKHLFERSYYYNKAELIIDNKEIEETIKSIKAYLN